MRLLAIIVGLIVFLDQLTKFVVSYHMEIGQSITVINNFFYITYLRNPGAAFGMLPYQTTFFVVITIIVAALILYYYRLLSEKHSWLRLGLSLQLGGALGNLIDRVLDGYVVDFLDLTVWPAVFNLADAAIVIGIVFFLIAFWRDYDLIAERS